MEKTRTLIAIGLCFLVLLFWQIFFVDSNKSVPEADQKADVQQAEPIEQTGGEQRPPLEKTTEQAGQDETKKVSRPAKIITVESPLYKVRISEKGAAVESFKLKNYRETVEKDSDLKELVNPQNKKGTILVGVEGGSVPGIGNALYDYKSSSEKIKVADKSEKILFRWDSGNGVVIEKAYVFKPESYLIDLEVTVENRTASTLNRLTLTMVDVVSQKSSRFGFTGPSAMVDSKVEELKIKKLSDKNRLSGNITWSAFQDQYFMSTIIPSKPTKMSVDYSLKQEKFLESRIVLPEANIQPNTKAQYNFQAYFGPKNISILKDMGHQLEKVVDFGMFDWLARPCLWIMNLIYRFIPNYGVAIILLTLLIKGLLWPLGNKSYKSMSQMKKMQPLMAEIREKYKDDKQKMNMELMSLYKTYKVNPLGGCLPMFVQLPVLFALYRMLYMAVELRHEPFIGWIQDLSAPERLFNFGFSIPMMTPPTGIPVLTILMGVSMYIQQKMQPPMGDPAQAKMMMFMPIFLVVICMNLSSGLVLYWCVSNILSILQQYYVTKKTT